MIALPGAPFPVTYRELWLPPGINNNATLPTSIEGGHELALTGARKGTTCDGVHFNGTATSNINCGVLHNAVAKFWVSLRFKLDQPFSAASPTTFYLWGKRAGAADFTGIWLNEGNGRLYWQKRTGGADDFIISAAPTSWNANQWYHVIASISNVNAVRLVVEEVAVTDADVSALTNGGAIIIGDLQDPGVGNAFVGVIDDIVMGTDDLTATEETELYRGIHPADAVNFYPVDEGRGVTVYDRGSGGNNGTLDTSASWAWGQVEQPILSLDGINDRGQSSAGVDISGDLTLVWAGKIKSTYNDLTTGTYITRMYVNADNFIGISTSWDASTPIVLYVEGAAVARAILYTVFPEINDYLILIATLTAAGVLKFFVNDSQIGVTTGVGVMSGLAATAYVGSSNAPGQYDVSKPLMIALIDGAFTDKQALTYSRYLKNVFNLPITI